MTYAEVEVLAKAYDNKLKANRFNDVVVVSHQDGSYFSWCNAFAMKKGTWYIVFTEHFGYHIFDKDDINSIQVLKLDCGNLKTLKD
jgi:hypothetical protein